MSHKYKDIDYTKIAHDLENNGYTIIENYIDTNILKNANQILLDNFNYDFRDVDPNNFELVKKAIWNEKKSEIFFA